MLKIKEIVLLTLVLLLSGCISNAEVENMSIDTQGNMFNVDNYFSDSLVDNIRVSSVSGGTTSNPNWDQLETITNKNFENALLVSLKNQNIYSKFGLYHLSADLIKLDFVGFIGGVVTIEVEYQLVNSMNNKVVLRKKIISSNEMYFEDEILGSRRYRRNIEECVKKNIAQLLINVSKLKLK